MNCFLTPPIAEFIKSHATDDVRKLALCKNPIEGEDLKFALQQIEGRQKASQKLPQWAANEKIIFPVKLSMEQCSSEDTAKYKSKIAGSGEYMADLTGGLGVDFYYISQNYNKAFYVEINNELCEIAEHNFNVLNKTCSIYNTNSETFLTVHKDIKFDLIYVDPARRDANGRKTVAPSDCLPDLTKMKDILKNQTKKVIIKYSPMLDINTAISELGNISSIYIISVNNECKELILIQDSTLIENNDIRITCTNLQGNNVQEFTFTYEEERNCSAQIANTIGAYLYEPNSSIMKAGAYKSIASFWDIKPLEKNSHLYTSDTLINDFQGRAFKVEGVCKINRADFVKTFPNTTQANISVRNCPFKPDDVKKKLKIKEGGNRFLFATTLSNKTLVLIGCTKC